MQTFTDTLLSKFDSAVRKLNPVNALIDKAVSHIAPTVEAKAGCSGYGCYVAACYWNGSAYGCQTGQSFVIWAMAQQPQECNSPNAGYCGGCDLYGYSC